MRLGFAKQLALAFVIALFGALFAPLVAAIEQPITHEISNSSGPTQLTEIGLSGNVQLGENENRALPADIRGHVPWAPTALDLLKAVYRLENSLLALKNALVGNGSAGEALQRCEGALENYRLAVEAFENAMPGAAAKFENAVRHLLTENNSPELAEELENKIELYNGWSENLLLSTKGLIEHLRVLLGNPSTERIENVLSLINDIKQMLPEFDGHSVFVAEIKFYGDSGYSTEITSADPGATVYYRVVLEDTQAVPIYATYYTASVTIGGYGAYFEGWMGWHIWPCIVISTKRVDLMGSFTAPSASGYHQFRVSGWWGTMW